MGRRILVGAVAVVGLFCVPAPGAHATCVPRGSEQLAQGRAGAVYTRGYETEAIACLHGSRHRARLIQPTEVDVEAVGPFALAGRYAAYYVRSCDDPAAICDYEVRVLDIKRARYRYRAYTDGTPFGQCVQEPRPGDCGDVGVIGAVVLKRNGAAAWTSCDGGDQDGCLEDPARPTLVVRLDSRGTRLLDRDRAVDPYSLRLTPRRRAVSWSLRGERRSATLR